MMISLLLLACLPYPTSKAADSAADDSADPGACIATAETDICDGIDNDCDQEIDEDAPIWYLDADGDDYGGETGLVACDRPSGYVSEPGDCDDTTATINPDRGEICGNGLDDDCDGVSEDGTAAAFVDLDGDGWGGTAVTVCEDDLGSYVLQGGDCDENVWEIHPGAPDSCETPADENCNSACRTTGTQSPGTDVTDRQRDGFWGGYTFYVGRILQEAEDDVGVANIPSNCLYENGAHPFVTILHGPNPEIEIDFPANLSICGLTMLSTQAGPILVASENSADGLYYTDPLDSSHAIVTSLVSANPDVRTWGSRVVNVGDLDGTGEDWVAIGSSDEEVHLKPAAGTVYLVSASDLSGTGSIQSVATTIFGDKTLHRLGDGITSADVNGDGYPEVVVSGQGDNSYSDGVVFVYDVQKSLSPGTLIPEADAVGSYYYGEIALTEFGHAVAVGDTDGDGAVDLAVSATILNGTGEILHFSGPLDRGIFEADTADTDLKPAHGGDDFGSVLTMMDFDNDGLQDIFASNTDLDGSPTLPSIVYGFYGPDFKETIEITDPSYEYLGMSLTPMGDHNGDGLEDLLIGMGTNVTVWVREGFTD